MNHTNGVCTRQQGGLSICIQIFVAHKTHLAENTSQYDTLLKLNSIMKENKTPCSQVTRVKNSCSKTVRTQKKKKKKPRQVFFP